MPNKRQVLGYTFLSGEMAEWPIASVLKTDRGAEPLVGSNPTLPALTYLTKLSVGVPSAADPDQLRTPVGSGRSVAFDAQNADVACRRLFLIHQSDHLF
jgi:hypothetical protein